MSDTLRNAWGHPVPPARSTDPHFVPEEDRYEDDSTDPDGVSNALDDETGDDVGDLTVAKILEAE